MVNITAAVQAAITAYATAVQLGGNTSIPLPSVASAMSALYLPGFTSFTLGGITTFANESIAATGIGGILYLYNQSGLGTDIRLQESRIEPVSEQSAFCWLTWKIYPKNCLQPWTFVDVYGFRTAANRTGGLEGGWELSDEYIQLLARVPNFFGRKKMKRFFEEEMGTSLV
jgi:hypothetical protein